MDFKKIPQFESYKNPIEFSYISKDSGGYISKNKNIFNEISLNPLNTFILECAVSGTPIFKIGESGNRVLILSGVHGNELSSQIASLNLINELSKREIFDTVYIIPFAAPKSTSNNCRTFDCADLNRVAHVDGSLTNSIIQTIDDLNINFVGDFHTTAINSNPGFEAIFSSKNPTVESFILATYISQDVGCEVIPFPFAASSYKGAMEDECNLRNIPAITGEVVSPFGFVGEGSVERSLAQMRSFLAYFGI